jgi:hypothetical protein
MTLRGHELFPQMALSSLSVVSSGSITKVKVAPERETVRVCGLMILP